MSVLGEFRRCLRNCVDALRDGTPEDAEPWLRALREAEDSARADLSRGALDVLALGAGGLPRPRFEQSGDAERFESLFDHLTQLCRAISGR